MRRILKTPAADLDLEEIGFYIAQDDLEASDRVLDSIDDKLQLIAGSPLMGRARPELAEGLRSLPVGNYVIYYRSSEDVIEIVRVLHAARDIDLIF